MIKVGQVPSARVRRSCSRCVLPAGNQIMRGCSRIPPALRPGLASCLTGKPANVGTRGRQRFALGLMLLGNGIHIGRTDPAVSRRPWRWRTTDRSFDGG